MIAPVQQLVGAPARWQAAPDERDGLLALAARAGYPLLALPGCPLPFGGTETAWQCQVALLSPLGLAWARAALHALRYFPGN